MQKSEFFYNLPKRLIAQTPLKNRSESRMLVLDSENKNIYHRHFYDIMDFIDEGDCLVLNDSKVIPARLVGQKLPSNAKVEILLQKPVFEKTWECIVFPGKRMREGSKLFFADFLGAEVLEVLQNGNRIVKFDFDSDVYSFFEILELVGKTPLPPYITVELEDKDRYQTVFARHEGSSAAPTAGLHFTDDILARLAQKKVSIAFVTLHVGLGTFRPVKTENIEDHHMHEEFFEIGADAARLINAARANKKKIIAVGTTSARSLESAKMQNGQILPTSKMTDIFIYPPYDFKFVDALVTNFHLPESTLLMLISAFAGKETILNAYNVAIEEEYRFFSFGDLMFIRK